MRRHDLPGTLADPGVGAGREHRVALEGQLPQDDPGPGLGALVGGHPEARPQRAEALEVETRGQALPASALRRRPGQGHQQEATVPVVVGEQRPRQAVACGLEQPTPGR